MPPAKTGPDPAAPADAAMQERIEELESRNADLRGDKRRAGSEIKCLREEVRSLTKEVQRLTVELEKIKHPPLIVGSVLDVLPDDRVVIKSSTGPNFVVPVADFVDRRVLATGTRVSLSQNNLTVVGILPSGKDPLVSGAEVVSRPTVTYADIAGLDDVVMEVRETVEYPLTRPELFDRVGIEPPKGVLLRGLPGTGKTMLGKAVANATDATFIHVVGSELVQKFIGEGARRVRELFALAREKAPSILFIDEIDAVGARRSDDGTSSNREVERTMMQLLAELDGFSPRGDVRLIAATNRADTLDPAILRPGRFDRLIDVPLPSPEGLQAILHLHGKGMRLAEGVDLAAIGRGMSGASGADAKALCIEAGMRAVREERGVVLQADFEAALAKLQKGKLPTRPQATGAELYA